MPLTLPGDLIVDSWVRFRRNARAYAEYAVLFVLLGTMRWALGDVARAIAAEPAMRLLMGTVFNLPTFFLLGVLSVALYETVWANLDDRTLDARTAFSAGVHRVFPAIWVSLVAFAGTVAGFALFIVPGVILSVRWRFAQAAVVLDDQGTLAALRSSARAVAGRWWPVCWRLVAPAVFFAVAGLFCTGVVNMVAGAALGDPSLFFGQYNVTGELPKAQDLVRQIIPTAINGLIAPLYLSVELALWRELKGERAA